jgi:hypothetical protein
MKKPCYGLTLEMADRIIASGPIGCDYAELLMMEFTPWYKEKYAEYYQQLIQRYDYVLA